MESNEYDILVIGAGPSGCSAAYHAALSGWRVLLLDRCQFPRDKVCGDGLDPRSVYLLAQMGVDYEDLIAVGAQKVDHFRIFRGGTLVEERPLPVGPGRAHYALGVARLSLDTLLWRKALAAGAQWCGAFEARAVKVDVRKPSVTVLGRQQGKETEVSAYLAIIAAGAVAWFYRTIGSRPPKESLGVGLRQYYELESMPSPTFDLFYEPYLPSGVAWIFPAGPRLVNVGVGERIILTNIKPRLFGTLHAFLNGNRVARQILADARPVGSPKIAPIRMSISGRLADDGLLWVGDAAGLAHPQSGKGIPYALESGQIAAQTASIALQLGDIRRGVLSCYEAEIRNRFSTDLEVRNAT
ncbi:MAG: geranylgeranyl reductase family protein [Candidatus Hadarchaeum sp.]